MLKSIWNISWLVDGSSGTGVFGLTVQPSSMYLTEASEYWMVFIWRATRVSIVPMLIDEMDINFITRISYYFVLIKRILKKKKRKKDWGKRWVRRVQAFHCKKGNGISWMKTEELVFQTSDNFCCSMSWIHAVFVDR